MDKDRERRAEGTLERLDPKEKVDNGVQRYDVHVTGLREVSWNPAQVSLVGHANHRSGLSTRMHAVEITCDSGDINDALPVSTVVNFGS